ncbi:IclR family transcriptional regulator [Peptoniphilus sp. AGMB00490]|uniref:IclR family transcriptional regulator n=1 Tax=Peptoniphilus faecalis TaxID=2731255 RepID=A0A848RJZ4_9FIRM|nr:IclR family transcriptional regulator [Peptoniphilus faecalis]NMW85749.1 IclR family transcriptional regulator [Peptoniphilus faecalis]
MEKNLKDDNVVVLDRAFDILELLSEKDKLSFSELKNSTGISKASLSRILTTLTNKNFISKNENTLEYSLTLKLFEVGAKAIKNFDYLELIRANLNEISNELGVIAQFSIEYNNQNILCIESYDNKNDAFSIYTRVGQTSAMYSTSAGKAILSTYSNENIISRFKDVEFKKFSPNTIDNLQDLLEDISLVRKNNFASDKEENEIGVFCIGSALKSYNNKALGAISLSSRSKEITTDPKYSKNLLNKVSRISKMLGYFI